MQSEFIPYRCSYS